MGRTTVKFSTDIHIRLLMNLHSDFASALIIFKFVHFFGLGPNTPANSNKSFFD